MLEEKNKIKESCEYIAEQSWKHWLHNEINVVDDITCIIMWLNDLEENK